LLHFIPTPIGNLEDISLRSLALLATSQIVFCEDTRVSKRLINLLQDRNDIDFLEKEFISMHSHNEDKIISELDPKLFEKDVVYLSDAGMPSISDPGCKLVNFVQKHNIEYEILPGSSASLLAYAASGFCNSQFLFFGFLPHKGKSRKDALDKALNSGFVTIIYESPHRIQKLVEELCKLASAREIFLIKEATKLHEKKFKGSTILAKEWIDNINIKGEWVVVLDAKKSEHGTITVDDILSLDLPKKQASKLISKITGQSIKECYQELVK
jgi:16S rRNA (cytidine1402-2'-O)-methyltransferase